MTSTMTLTSTRADEEFTVGNVLASIPKEAFVKDDKKALGKLATTVVFFASAYVTLSLAPWYLLPLAWFYAGAVFTGMFAIAHDCGHYSFFKSRALNTVVGGLCFIPILYPLEGWRLRHNAHHTNLRTSPSERTQPSKSLFRFANPIFWPYDIASLLFLYFDLSKFDAKEQRDARLSVYFSYMSGPVLLYAIISYWGVWEFVKFWFVPWAIFHFWKNALRLALPSVLLSGAAAPTTTAYTKYRDGARVVPESPTSQSLVGLTHYSFPRWFELLCHDINLSIPHYLSTDIPCYNLRIAHDSIMNSRWKDKIQRHEFGWALLHKYGSGGKVASTDAKEQTLPPLWKRLNWLHVPLFAFTHTMGLVALFTVEWNLKTVAFAVLYYYLTGLGITAGYHRLWAHRGYDAAYPVRLALMLFGSGAFEGSIRWWCRDHRVHHRYTDTDQDPYNAKRGFFYAHMGWMLIKEDPKRLGRANIDDLASDPMIKFQHKYYLPLATFMAVVFPTLVCGLGWGDYYGGYMVAGIVRLLFVHHATFCVNSLAHYLGDKPFADEHTPRDSFITAILTLGEGYHNFHHEFPKDYRNAIVFYQYDPTKWLIRALAFFGLTYNLHVFPQNEIEKGMLQMKEKELFSSRSRIDWGPEVEALPQYTFAQVARRKDETGELWMIIDGLVHDVSRWVFDHPGGRALIDAFVGKDATKAFNGGVYCHSNAGHNMLSQLRIGRVLPDESGHREPLAEHLYNVEFKVQDKKKD